MSQDLLSGSTPSRLVCSRGRWSLELTRLVAVDSHVFQPRKQRLDGSEAILSHLKRLSDPGNLVQGAAHLMRAARSDEERTFEAVDGEWVPLQASPADTHAEANPKQRAALEGVIADLRAELLILRASHQRLRDRVAALEARVEGTPLPERRVAAQPVATPARFPGARGETSGAAAKPAQVRAGARVEPQSELALAVSTEQELLVALAELLGEDSGYAVTPKAFPESKLERLGMYFSSLIDESGRDVGAVVLHVLATADLGGRLAGVPASDREQQARSGTLSDPILQASSEVCNTLTGVIARSATAKGVRSAPLEEFDPERLDWVGAARQRITLNKPDAGALWILGR